MTATVGILIVSHSRQLAAGVVELARQMAPDVPLAEAGGMPDGSLGTSYDRVQQAALDLRGRSRAVVALADLGSAMMMAEIIAEELHDNDHPIAVIDAPLVEGAIAAAVAAAGGGDIVAVTAAARAAVHSFEPSSTPAADGEDAVAAREEVRRTITLHNSLGLHARPAAMLARLASSYDAELEINGVDATSVLALMSLGLVNGDTLDIRATGKDANDALDAVAAIISDGFGEE